MSKKKLETLTYGIVGLGRFGYALAMELAKSGAELLVLDGDEEKVREMREYTENAFVVKTLDKKTLAETGIQNCDVAVVCIGEQIQHYPSRIRLVDRCNTGNSGKSGTNKFPAKLLFCHKACSVIFNRIGKAVLAPYGAFRLGKCGRSHKTIEDSCCFFYIRKVYSIHILPAFIYPRCRDIYASNNIRFTAL